MKMNDRIARIAHDKQKAGYSVGDYFRDLGIQAKSGYAYMSKWRRLNALKCPRINDHRKDI